MRCSLLLFIFPGDVNKLFSTNLNGFKVDTFQALFIELQLLILTKEEKRSTIFSNLTRTRLVYVRQLFVYNANKFSGDFLMKKNLTTILQKSFPESTLSRTKV